MDSALKDLVSMYMYACVYKVHVCTRAEHVGGVWAKSVVG